MYRALIVIGLFSFVAISQLGERNDSREPTPLQEKQHGKLTIQFPEGVATETVDAVGIILDQSALFDGIDASDVHLSVHDDGGVIVDMPIITEQVSPEVEAAFALYARLISDLANDSAPVRFRLFHQSNFLNVVDPMRPINAHQHFAQDTFFYYDKNISAAQMERFAQRLIDVQLVSKKHMIFELEKQGDAFTLVIQLAFDHNDADAMANADKFLAPIPEFLSTEVFDGAPVTLIGCNEARERFENVTWTSNPDSTE